ncbi:hypothetical protein B0H12DRAFT_1071051 [Mycena haematopus]|nr:hypothetical protein B0H12DRAFT_1071051 [Mycena haematopus]
MHEIFDDDEARALVLAWNPAEWISANKIYRDVPPVVEAARLDLLKIPPKFTHKLPPKTLSIAQLLEFDLPPVMEHTGTPMDVDSEHFSDLVPTGELEEILPFLVVPTHKELGRLLNEVGQAWFDGKKSLLTWTNPDIALPFWITTYWGEILDAIEAKERWLAAASWMRLRGKTGEELVQKRTVEDLWNVLGWHGSVRGFAGVSVQDLASFFSTDFLGSNLVDAMVDLLSVRLKSAGGRHSDTTVIANTTFSQFIELLRPGEDGNCVISSHPGAKKYLDKYGSWFRTGAQTELHFVMYRDPKHWTTCKIDFHDKHIRYGDGLKWERPEDFFLALKSWTAEHFPDVEFLVTEDLPGAIQTDGYSCPMIAVNAIAHNTLGDPLWTRKSANTMRMKAFCDIAIGKSSPLPASTVSDPDDFVENVLAVNPDINDTLMGDNTAGASSRDDAPQIVGPNLAAWPADTHVGTKKRAADAGDHDRGKGSFKPAPSKSKSKIQTASPSESSLVVGISKSASAARKQRADIKSGHFQATAKKTENFRMKCREKDADAGFEETAKKVQCSNCKVWIQMQEAYSTSRFSKHVDAKKCCPPPPEPASVPDPTTRMLTDFQMVPTRPKPKNPPPAPEVQRPCPGLTRAFDDAVGKYLDRTVANGGGGRAVNHYSSELFGKDFTDLTEKQKATVYTAQAHDYTWRNDVNRGIMACFATGTTACLKTVKAIPNSPSTPVCSSCKLLATSKVFKNAIRREAAASSNLKYVPRIHQNEHAGMLFAKFAGLEALLAEDNEFSVERRYFQHVVSGKFKDDKVFTGIIQAKVMAKDREIRGKGLQNFKYDSDMDAVFGLVHTISPRAYRELGKHFPLRSERSIKHVISTSPRFPIGITDETFVYAKEYIEDYKYPHGAPLSVSVDDTKLFPALRPLYDGVKKFWYIVGTTGDHIAVPNAQALHETLDELESNAELATKLRLWVLQIPLPGVPPLVVAIMPIGSKVKGPQLADWQIRLLKGLVSHGFRFTSSGGDGASVERDCQRRSAAAGKLVEISIQHPDPDYADIKVQLSDLDGNIWAVIQDAKHGRKTFRNNVFSGARTLTLGNFVVFYEHIHTLGIKPNTPLYRRDFIKSDRMDDPAAARFFSAAFLEQAAEDPGENLGLVVYLLVFGDFIDAWQSRTLSHHERAKIVIRTHLFLQTWRMFLDKAGYPEARHFISKEAFDIAQILINGLLGLIIIHRDYLGAQPCPLLPWFNASEPNEHCFSGMRDITADFTMQQAILIVPKLRAKMQASVRIPKNQSDFKKQASGYCHTYYSAQNIDYDLLSRYPSDIELSAAYEMAGQENECLWSLLGIHPARIKSAPTRGLMAPPPPDPAFEHLYLQEDNDPEAVGEKTPAVELQEMIDALKTTANLSRAADAQLDACVMASVALSMDELAKVEDMPESDPERFAEIQRDIARALATHPTAFIALLQNMADSAAKNTPAGVGVIETPPVTLVDVSSSDLTPFVALRRQHQTEEARTGVRTYTTPGTYTNHKTGVVKPLTDRQILARQMQAIIRQDQERGSSTGLNRKMRWTEQPDSSTAAAKPKTGNAANAELAASGRSKEAIKRRRTIFGKLKCLSTVAESGIGADDGHRLEDGCYAFALTGSDVMLNGGKAGAHSWIAATDTIGALSFVVAQVYQHEFRRRFKIIHGNDAFLGTIRFAHLPMGSFLVLLPKDEAVNSFQNHLEIGVRAHKIYDELMAEKETLAKAVASLNTVRRKGKANIHILDLAEDDCVEE